MRILRLRQRCKSENRHIRKFFVSMALKSQIESLLFISNKALSVKKLASLTKAKTQDVRKALDALVDEYNSAQDKGIRIIKNIDEFQMMTSPENSKLVSDFIKDETTGELTRPSLETLTIIAYRGPITKAELEQIRGVNCSLILRNLMIRGLVEMIEDKKTMNTYYRVTMSFLKFLGVESVEQLPNYRRLSSNQIFEDIIQSASHTDNV